MITLKRNVVGCCIVMLAVTTAWTQAQRTPAPRASERVLASSNRAQSPRMFLVDADGNPDSTTVGQNITVVAQPNTTIAFDIYAEITEGGVVDVTGFEFHVACASTGGNGGAITYDSDSVTATGDNFFDCGITPFTQRAPGNCPNDEPGGLSAASPGDSCPLNRPKLIGTISYDVPSDAVTCDPASNPYVIAVIDQDRSFITDSNQHPLPNLILDGANIAIPNGQCCNGQTCVPGSCPDGQSTEVECTNLSPGATWTEGKSCSDPCPCTDDADCDDGIFCNGAEKCDSAFSCQPGIPPCPGLDCDEEHGWCFSDAFTILSQSYNALGSVEWRWTPDCPSPESYTFSEYYPVQGSVTSTCGYTITGSSSAACVFLANSLSCSVTQLSDSPYGGSGYAHAEASLTVELTVPVASQVRVVSESASHSYSRTCATLTDITSGHEFDLTIGDSCHSYDAPLYPVTYLQIPLTPSHVYEISVGTADYEPDSHGEIGFRFDVAPLDAPRDPAVRYVDATSPNDPGSGSWDDPYRRIQDAIASPHTIDGDTVVVLPGYYCENLVFCGKAVTLIGGASYDPKIEGDVVIDGSEPSDSNFASAITFIGTEEQDSRLVGLIITGGMGHVRGDWMVRSGGGVFCNGTSPTIQNCLLWGNSATDGSALAYCDGRVDGCTMASNDGTVLKGCNGLIRHCIIWDTAVALSGSAAPAYSCIENWVGGGEGNISSDPRFVDAAMNDYHLLEDSPCINAGDPSYMPEESETDIDGEARLQECRVDIGADETPYYRDVNHNGIPDACECNPPAELTDPNPPDGATDVPTDSQLSWADPVVFTERVISTTADGATSVFAADVDGDGNIDVLSASVGDDKIAWYESDGGSPPIFTERVISSTADLAMSVFAADVNGDGNIDVLSASRRDDKIAWYESDGSSPPVFAERVISIAADGAMSVFAADVDGDGNIDVLSASVGDDKIAWYESDGGSPPGFTERIISTAADSAYSVFAADVDDDGDTDVLSASVADDKIAWYDSDGASPPSFTERVISTAADGAASVFAADVDGDGDMDVFSASWADDKIAWYESDGGLPPAFTERVISTAADSAYSVFAADVDGDGDTDVLSVSAYDDKIAWYESDGGLPPAFTERVISTAADSAYSVFAADVDGDGDTDVLSASEYDDKIAWYENHSIGPCQTTYDVYFGMDPTCSTLTKICDDLTEPTCDPGPLDCGATYYWKVVAKNIVGETEGPCWAFTTEGCPCDGLRLFVDAGTPAGGDGCSWDTAFNKLQDALFVAGHSCCAISEIWVAAGTYRPDYDPIARVHTGDREATFQLLNAVAIYGGFAGNEDPTTFNLASRNFHTNESILSGDLNSDDMLVVCLNDLDCANNGERCGPDDFCLFPANHIDNSYNVLTGNGTDRSAVINGFTISGGSATVGDFGPGDSGGGGMLNVDGSPTVTRCNFVRNSAGDLGGGAMFNQYGSPEIRACTFIGNHARGFGGAVLNDANARPTLTSCVFSGNVASLNRLGLADGGGLCNSNSSPILWNCTFSGNITDGVGGGMYSIGAGSHPVMNNSILWGNIPDQVVGPFTGGYNCIDLDPMFVDADGPDDLVGTVDDDVHLVSDSACINAGDPTFVPATGETDIDGEVRIQHCRVDVGADETAYFRDCQPNGTADACDIREGISLDDNGNGFPDECEPRLNSSDPPDGYIDPRGEDCWIDGITMIFDMVVRNLDGSPIDQDAFSTSCTGGECPEVASVDASQNPTIAVQLTGQTEPRRWCTVTANVESELGIPGGGSVTFGRLPCDVNQSGCVTPSDANAFRDAFFAGDPEADMNCNGNITPTDANRYRWCFLGEQGCGPWNGVCMDPKP